MIDFEYPEGATPIDLDEAEGLLLPHIRTGGISPAWLSEGDNQRLLYEIPLFYKCCS